MSKQLVSFIKITDHEFNFIRRGNQSFLHSCLITGFETREIWRVPLVVEQQLRILQEFIPGF